MNCKKAWPPELVAETTKGVASKETVGVPEIVPVEELIVKPVGSSGLIE